MKTKAEKTSKANDRAKLAAGAAEIRRLQQRAKIVKQINKIVGKAKATKANGKAKAATTKAPAKKSGAAKTIFGFSVTSVVRRLGKAGFKPADAIKAIQSKVPSISPNTIRVQVNAGRNGLRGEPAKLTAVQLKQLQAAAV